MIATKLTRAAIAAVLTVIVAVAAAGAKPAPGGQQAQGRRHAHRDKAPKALPPGIEVPVYSAGPFPFHDGERLVYRASWLGIPAAEARIELTRNRKHPEFRTAQAWIETNRLVDLLFKMRDYLRENFRRGSLRSHRMFIRQHENSRLNEYRVKFDHDAGLVTMIKTNHKGVRRKQFRASDPWGPLSGAMMALTQPLQPGRTLVFDVFTGSHRFVFDFKITRKERISTSLGSFDAFKVVPGVIYLSKGDLRKKARRLTVWVSADKRRLPLRLEASVFIGSIRVELIRVEHAEGPTD